MLSYPFYRDRRHLNTKVTWDVIILIDVSYTGLGRIGLALGI